MSYTSLPVGAYVLPGLSTGGTPALGSTLLSAAAHKYAFVIQVPKTGTLDKFEFNLASVTSGPVDVKASFQTVNASGNPDEVVDQYRVISCSAGGWQIPGLITSDGTDGGSKRSVTKGEWLACVLEFNSFVAATGFSPNRLNFADGKPFDNSGYPDVKTTGSWLKTTTGYPVLALKYDDGSYERIYPGVYPVESITAYTVASNTTPDEVGLRFQFPMNIKIDGLLYHGSIPAVTEVVLYDSTPSALVTVSVDPDYRQLANFATQLLPIAEQTLTANTTYRLTVKPTSVVSVTLYSVDLDSNVLLSAILGSQWYYTSRTDAGAFSDDDTKFPIHFGVRISAIEDAGGGGGGGNFSFIG